MYGGVMGGRMVAIIVVIKIFGILYNCFRLKVRPLHLTPHTMLVKVMMTPLTLATLNLQALMIPMTAHSNTR